MRFVTLFRSLVATRRFGLLHLRAVSGPTRLDCLGGQCGLCCRAFKDVMVERSEAAPLVQLKIVKEVEGTILMKQSATACAALHDNFCSVYEVRPRSCRDYPWYNIEGKLYFDRGCPSIRFDADGCPDIDSIRRWEWYLRDQSRFVQELLTLLCRTW